MPNRIRDPQGKVQPTLAARSTGGGNLCRAVLLGGAAAFWGKVVAERNVRASLLHRSTVLGKQRWTQNQDVSVLGQRAMVPLLEVSSQKKGYHPAAALLLAYATDGQGGSPYIHPPLFFFPYLLSSSSLLPRARLSHARHKVFPLFWAMSIGHC
jgi:hypothetical protein